VLFDGDVRAIDFRYLEINPAFTQHTGLRDVVGKRAREVTPDLEEEWFETYGRVAATGEAVRFVSQSRNLGGRWFDAYAFHLDGMASHQVAVLFRDITASKMLERLRVDILALAGHDLRTPLTVVNLAAQLLRAKQTYDAGSVDRILSEARRMGRMVDDLSDAFRLESGLAALRSAPLDLVPLVNESVVRIRSQTPSHTIMIESPAEPVFGDWDRERLGQALSHLLEYAIKNSPNGGTILVRVSVGDAEVSISVVNYGAGISVEAASQSDDRLERTGEDERASRLDIGLFIAQMHIEAHGGRFRIKSEPGNGRSFNFSLPRGV
jgi:signal transduction histidine kinase